MHSPDHPVESANGSASSDNEDLVELAKEIAKRLALYERDDALWDVEDVAKYLRVSRSTIEKEYINTRTFPKAIMLPRTRGGKSRKKWYAGQIKSWAATFQE